MKKSVISKFYRESNQKCNASGVVPQFLRDLQSFDWSVDSDSYGQTEREEFVQAEVNEIPASFPASHFTDDDFLHEAEPGIAKDSLYPGATVSKDEAVAKILSFYRDFKLSRQAFGGVLKLLDDLLPAAHQLPKSSYLFDRVIGRDDAGITEHRFCRAHRVYVGKTLDGGACKDCSEADAMTDGPYESERFFTIDIATSWARLMSDSRVIELIRRPLPANCLTMRSGRILKDMTLHSDEGTVTLFMDAMRLAKSSISSSVTVVSLVCNDLPVSHRFSFARPALIYVGEVKPDANILLQPVVTELLALGQRGLCHNLSSPALSKHHLVVCVSDAVAKCDIQGFRQFNSRENGCTVCTAAGQARESRAGPTVFPYIFGQDAPDRTHDQTIKDAAAALSLLESDASATCKEKGVGGVKFPSQLLRLPRRTFDIIRSVPGDVMHIVMGVGNQLIDILLAVALDELPCAKLSFQDQATVRRRIVTPAEAATLSAAMADIVFPEHISRMPRALCYSTVYKASETLHFFLYTIPFLLRRQDDVKRIIPREIRRMLSGFSLALHLLLADRTRHLPPEETIAQRADAAEALLKEFLHCATLQFGPDRMTYNFHSLLHLTSSYRNFGPLYEISAFPHESNLGLLKSLVHGTNSHLLDKEACNKYVTYLRAAEMSPRRPGCDRATITLTGKPLPRHVLDSVSEKALQNFICTSDLLADTDLSVEVYRRATLINGLKVETSLNAQSHEVSRSNCIYLLKNDSVVKVLYLLRLAGSFGSYCAVVCTSVASRAAATTWKTSFDNVDLKFSIDYPQFFVEKPLLAQSVAVHPASHLLEPVIFQAFQSVEKYMIPSFFMPKN